MRYLIALLWLIIFTKKLFFWVYLWQLKEYHIGRFLDHFRTVKGKKLIFSGLLAIKLLFLLGIIFSARRGSASVKFFLVYSAAFILFIEVLAVLNNFYHGILKKPVLTRKAEVILSTGISLAMLILFFSFILEFKLTKLTVSFLILDAISPIIFSVIVLSFQPLAVILRNRIIKKAKKKRTNPAFNNLLAIGVTGSYGKTSTKDFLASILSTKYNVLKTKEHQNSEVGVSQCILEELAPEHQIFICEMGAYGRGGIRLLCDIVRPKVGILTGINEQHMATFGSLDNIIKTKYELIESLPADGVAFFNAQNNHCQDLYQKTAIKKILYGAEAAFPGEEDILGAMAVAKELGMTDEEISLAVSKIENKFPGIKIKKGFNGLNIIDATYSANPTGVIANIEYLKSFPGKKVIVMPCLIELGSASEEVHLRIGQKVAEVCDLAIITTKDRLQEIKATAGEKAVFIEDAEQIFEKIKSTTKSGDVVLLESRVPSQLIHLLTEK